MSLLARIWGPVAFSVGTTLVLMFLVSRFPGMEIPPAYWVFGALCPAVVSSVVVALMAQQTERIRVLQRQREEFLQLLSHDMRLPQSSILTLLDQAGDEWSPDVAHRIRGYAARTLALADGMVQLSRAQFLQFTPQELNLVDIGNDAIDALAPQARARGITFDFPATKDEILVRGEPSLLARVFINLLDNAVKFSPEGSVVRFAMAPLQRGKSELALCTISDCGIGIPTAQMAMLYNRFVATRQGPIGRGVGLGLPFVQTVIARHGGAIHCESQEGCGTTFRIELPIAGGSVAALVRSA